MDRKDCKLDFNKYKERLEIVFPTYTEEKLKEIFIARVEYWGMIIENIDKFN